MGWEIIAKTVVVQTVTYMLVGLVAYRIFDYSTALTDPVRVALMRPLTDPIVRAGVLFQPIRGLLFGVVFYLLRDVLFGDLGWLTAWVMLVFVGIISTFAPADSSIEGFIYNKPRPRIWGGLVEILVQSFLLAVVTYYWVTQDDATWATVIMASLFVVALAIPVLALVAARSSTATGRATPGTPAGR